MPTADKPDIFDQPYMPIWCDGCNQQGYIFDKHVYTASFFVVCPHCGRETSSVNCPECDMGGEYVENIQDRPTSWTCPNCKTSYPLPSKFYDEPKTLYLEDDLPEGVILEPAKPTSPILTALGVFFPFVLFPFAIGGAVAAWLSPTLFVFTGLTSIFGYIVGLFVVSKNPRPREKVLAGCFFTAISAGCGALFWTQTFGIQTVVISYLLGILYGMGLLIFLQRYTARLKAGNSRTI